MRIIGKQTRGEVDLEQEKAMSILHRAASPPSVLHVREDTADVVLNGIEPLLCTAEQLPLLGRRSERTVDVQTGMVRPPRALHPRVA